MCQCLDPWCIQVVFQLFLLEGVHDRKLLLGTEFKQKAPIFNAVSYSTLSKNTFPGYSILTHSSVEVVKDDNLIICWDICQETSKISIETIFFCRICLESWGINTEEHDILLVMKWEAHGNDMVRMSCWQDL